jgi:hypothetical protein
MKGVIQKKFWLIILHLTQVSKQHSVCHSVSIRSARWQNISIRCCYRALNQKKKHEAKIFFYKSAAISRAWPRPLRGAILIPPALLVVADSSNFSLLTVSASNLSGVTFIWWKNLIAIKPFRMKYCWIKITKDNHTKTVYSFYITDIHALVSK